MKRAEIKRLFERFSNLRILILGDVMVDAYIWGNVERVSPEAPVPVVTVDHEARRLGGAANVAVNIQALGAKPVLCSITGHDKHNGLFREMLRREGIEDRGIIEDPERQTTVKTRVLGNRQQLLRVDRESHVPVSAGSIGKMMQFAEYVIEQEKPDAVLFQDYDKGTLSIEAIERTVALASRSGIPVLVDPKSRNFWNYHNVQLFKPNLKEFASGTQREIDRKDAAGIFEAARILHEKNRIGIVLVTLSESGIFVSDGKNYSIIPAYEVRDVADVSGAGDTVIGVASLCLAAGLDPVQLATVANLAAGLVCEKVGVVPVDKDRLMDECVKQFSGYSAVR